MSDGTKFEPLMVDCKTASAMLGISLRKLWSLSAGGEIPSLKIGTSKRYAVADLRAWVEKLRTEQARAA
jgi:predicted DNA-binding transcriptional regulator AlpA